MQHYCFRISPFLSRLAIWELYRNRKKPLIAPIGWQISSYMTWSPVNRKKLLFWGQLFPGDPGRITVSRPLKGYDLFGVHYGLRLPVYWSGFRVLWGAVSTPPENIVLQGYFSKIPDLIGFWPCNLAVSGWSRFLPPVLCHRGCERQPEARCCPPMQSRRRIGVTGVFFRFF